MSERLQEQFVDFLQECVIEGMTIRNVAFCGPVSKNGRSYPESTLQKARPLYEGREVNVNHQPAGQASVTFVAGKTANPRFENGRIRGDIVCFETSAGRDLLALAKAGAAGIGMSHTVAGTLDEARKTVIDIHDVISVDCVKNPATTSSFKEDVMPVNYAEVTLDDLRKSRPDILGQITSESTKSLTESHAAALTAARTNALEEGKKEGRKEGIAAERERTKEITALAEQAKLPSEEVNKLLSEGKSLAEAQGLMWKRLCEGQKPPEGDAAPGDGTGRGDKDPYAAFRKEYREQKQTIHDTAPGLTEEQWVRSRCLTEGMTYTPPQEPKKEQSK